MKLEILKKAERGLAISMQWICIACLVALFYFLITGIITRVFPITRHVFSSMGWIDDMVEFTFAWMIFLGAAVLCKKRKHFSIGTVPEWLGRLKAGRGLNIFLSFMALVFFLVFTYEGALLALQATDITPMMELPKRFWYLSMPISGIIMIGYTIRDIWMFFTDHSQLSER
jgi:TRAP-type transport system small permease protein